jgi:hypothetical protein
MRACRSGLAHLSERERQVSRKGVHHNAGAICHLYKPLEQLSIHIFEDWLKQHKTQ